jgi:aconitate hydratase
MGKSITQKIIEGHLVSGRFIPGSEIAIRIDQTLTQDATGTMAYLEFESMHIPKVRTELSVSYIDHNTVQIGFENADDHRYLQSIARKYGIYLSRAGNGICHQVHLERFGRPGKTLIGADSHTPTGGALGMIAIGAGGLDVALAMAGEPFYLTCPKVIRIDLVGTLPPWVSAKDIILHVLSLFTTKGNVGSVFEYGADGTSALTVPERATIANMGAECGVTTSVFPSDVMTRRFLEYEHRAASWTELLPDPDAAYDRTVRIDLGALAPLASMPHSPDRIRPVSDLAGIEVQQVCIGSCTNSSYKDLVTVAKILKGKTVHRGVSLIMAPGSKQVLDNLARNGYLSDLLSAGVRLMENACGFCIGNSQSPPSGGVSLRTSNRNFLGRSGTKNADIYLVSPETAAAAVITGRITDPRQLGMDYPKVDIPEQIVIDDGLIMPPDDSEDTSLVAVDRGPNIGEAPQNGPLPQVLSGKAAIKVGDKITTDHIIPAGARMKYRSNIPKYAKYVFEILDKSFAERAGRNRDEGLHNVIVAGNSYGQGSSREHAAICPMYLGVKAVIAKSFERIHAANLVNFGILPLHFKDDKDYEGIDEGDLIEITDMRAAVTAGNKLTVKNLTKRNSFEVSYDLSDRQKAIVLAGGILNLR